MGLDEAGVLFSATRDLVLAAACSAHAQRAYFPPRKPQRALEYVRHVNLAAPEAGSFILVLESPLPSSFAQPIPGDGGASSGDEPFERTVLLTLAMAGVTVRKSIELSTVSGTVERFAEGVGAGVNANYCDALATMLEEGTGRNLSIAFSWSTSRPMVHAIPSMLAFSRTEAPVLRAAARLLKERAPIAGFELTGLITNLKALALAEGGDVTVAGLVDDSIRQVQFSVDAEDYQRAIEAHRYEKLVSVEGELVKEGRSFRLNHPRLFSVASWCRCGAERLGRVSRPKRSAATSRHASALRAFSARHTSGRLHCRPPRVMVEPWARGLGRHASRSGQWDSLHVRRRISRTSVRPTQPLATQPLATQWLLATLVHRRTLSHQRTR